MAQTLCGKDCTDCTYRESTACPGCKVGPGNQTSSTCEIAKCCRAKGHTDCTGCTLSTHCGSFLSRRDMPEQRRKKQEAEAFLAAELHDRAAFLGPRMLLLLVAIFFATLGIWLAALSIWLRAMEWIRFPAAIVGLSFGGIYGIVLLWLSKREEKYRPAGICMLVAAALNIITVIFFRNDSFILPLFFLLSFIITVVAVLFEIKGHVSALTGFDHGMATRWEKLLVFHFCFFSAFIARVLFVQYLSKLGEYVFSLLGLAWFVVLCTHFVYIALTAKRFCLHVKKKG